jgi:mersacidin/lichenicidin family type 2 lantibiotic
MQQDMIRAWKDEEYKQSLSQEEQAGLPESPAGEVELSEAELELVSGTGGYGGGAGGVGGYSEKGVYSEKADYKSALGINNNSYYCGNFSIRPTTNIGAVGVVTSSLVSPSISALGSGANTTTTAFDFSCSISGLAGVCLGGGA